MKIRNDIPEDITKNDEPRCTLSDEDLLKRCGDWISKLCDTGGRAWNLTIPVNFSKDPDMLFGELIRRYKKTLRKTRLNQITGSKNCKNDDTAEFSKPEITGLIAKVHESMEGRYDLSGEDLFNIHAALCKLQ